MRKLNWTSIFHLKKEIGFGLTFRYLSDYCSVLLLHSFMCIALKTEKSEMKTCVLCMNGSTITYINFFFKSLLRRTVPFEAAPPFKEKIWKKRLILVFGWIHLVLNKTLMDDTSVKRAQIKTFVYYNFTKFQQNWIKHKKVFICAHLMEVSSVKVLLSTRWIRP